MTHQKPLLPENVTAVYNDYKEPLKPVEGGFGYMGTLAENEEHTHIQCHICGLFLKSLGTHLKGTHNISASQYKERFGFAQTIGLVSRESKAKYQRNAVIQFAPERSTKALVEWRKNLKKNGQVVKRGKPSLEWRNRKGLCPDQVLERILELKKRLGRVPSQQEFKRYYKGRYFSSIILQHGSYQKAVNKLGLQTAGQLRRLNPDKLLADLAYFHETQGRIPMTKDFKNSGLLRPYTTYISVFGTLNNARLEAGLDAIVPLGFGRFVQMTPQEYSDYKTGKRKGVTR